MNFIYDENNNLILENDNNYVVGDIIVIDNKNEYEVTFIDTQNNLAYAEFNGEYFSQNFSSRYKKNIVLFSCFFVVFLIVIFSLSIFYTLKSRRKKIKSPKHH